LGVLHNYFDSSTKLFSNLYPAKFLDVIFQHNCSFCTNNLRRDLGTQVKSVRFRAVDVNRVSRNTS